MDSVLDDVKVTANEIVCDDHLKQTSGEVVTDHDKETSESVSDEKEDRETSEVVSEAKEHEIFVDKKLTFVFVLGGPGGGKSTQCSKLAQELGYTHLSSGDLLRKAMKSDSEIGLMIESMLEEAKSVPPDVTMRILLKAIFESGNDKFLLDGFPRDEEIRAAFEDATNIEPELVLFFDCSEEEREKRILSRNQGRVDDKPETIWKRFRYFEEHTSSIVEYYRSRGKVCEIDSSKTMEEVSEAVKRLLMPSSTVQPEEEEERHLNPSSTVQPEEPEEEKPDACSGELENEISKIKI